MGVYLSCTMPIELTRPEPGEYAEMYEGYIRLIPDGDLTRVLRSDLAAFLGLIASMPAERADFRYAPGKWILKEVVGHVADSERILAYRALRIARGDDTPLAGYDENAYVARGGFASRTMRSLLDELAHVRRGTIALFDGLSPETATLQGTANGFPVTVRALGYIIAGHARHHANIIKERYV